MSTISYKRRHSAAQAAIELAIPTGEQFDDAIEPKQMVGPLKV